MSILVSSDAPASHAVARAGRIAAAVLLPIGPAAIAALRFLLPYDTTDDGTTVVRAIAAHPAREDAVIWLGLLGAFTLVPAAVVACRVVARRAPRLATEAMLLMIPGYIGLSWLDAADAVVLYGVRHQLPAPVLADMYTSLHPVYGVAEGVFVVGHVLGTVLLGVALVRTRLVPLWAGWATTVSQPLHVLAAVVWTSHTLDLAAWALLVAGFAALSVAILRDSPDLMLAPG
jgi:hypothetical protein